MIMNYSWTGMIIVVTVIVLLILVSIQFTLNQILRELREIRKKKDRNEFYGDQGPYRRRDWDE